MTEFIQEGEIMLEEEDDDQLKSEGQVQLKQVSHSQSAATASVAANPQASIPAPATSVESPPEETKEQNHKSKLQSIHQVEEWKSSTLVDLFESHSSSYEDALSGSSTERAEKRPRIAAQTLEQQYQNYQQIMNENINGHHAAAASPAASRAPPATSSSTPTFIRSQSHHLSSKQQHLPQTNSLAAPVFASPNAPRGPLHRGPLATSPPAASFPVIERAVASPTDNRLMAERIKQMQAQRRQSGEKSTTAHTTSSSSPPAVLPVNTPEPAAIASAVAAAASTTAAPLLPAIPPSLPPYPASMFHPPPPPPQLPPHLLSSLPSAPFALGPGGPMPVPLGAATGANPPSFSHAEMMEEASLTNLLLSWYYAGYYTGKHQATKAMRQEQQLQQTQAASTPSSSSAMEAAIQQYTASTTGTKRKFDSK